MVIGYKVTRTGTGFSGIVEEGYTLQQYARATEDEAVRWFNSLIPNSMRRTFRNNPMIGRYCSSVHMNNHADTNYVETFEPIFADWSGMGYRERDVWTNASYATFEEGCIVFHKFADGEDEERTATYSIDRNAWVA